MKKRNLPKSMAVMLAAAVSMSSMSMPVLAANLSEVPVQEEGIQEAEAAEVTGDAEMVYGTVNLPYADFFYGELTGLEPGACTAVLATGVTDKVTAAGYRDTGMYDAVSSCTTSKSTQYESTYYTTSDAGVTIEGLKEVQIAVPKTLYDAAMASNDTSNPAVGFVKAMTVVPDASYTEYKVLSGDGTFSKMVSDAVVDEDAAASITTTSAWGQYQISVENIEVDKSVMQGVVLTLADGTKVGLKHGDNLWLRTGEMAFAVTDGFVEPHNNTIEWQRFQNMQGATIKQITYLVKDAADVVINTDLLCKSLLADGQGITAADASYQEAGTVVPFTFQVPSDANYSISSVADAAGEIKAADANTAAGTKGYTYSDNQLTLNAACHPGTYEVTLTSPAYQDVNLSFVVKSNMKAENIQIAENVLSVKDEVSTLAEYIASITSITVNGTEYDAAGYGSVIFGENGAIDFAAEKNFHGTVTTYFAQGAEGDYEIVLKASGFPDVSAKVGKSSVYVPVNATIKASSVTKTYKANQKFQLNATTNGGKLTYTTSDKAVAVVSSTGTVTIKGTGVAEITITSAATDLYKKTTKTIKVTVKPAAQTISSLKSSKKQTLTVKWKKDTKVTGYQIVLATNSKFTKNVKTVNVKSVQTISQTVKSLKAGTKYYVKVRSYKTSGTTKLYGAYSTVKTVTVKK